MSITYTPHGTSGYTCEIRGRGAVTATVRRIDGAAVIEATPASLPTQGLVGALERYAEHEHLSRRVRSTVKQQHHREAAAEWRAIAEEMAELLVELTEETAHGWCSDCMALGDHRIAKGRTRWGTRQFVCTECGSPTGRCSVPRCKNFADRGGGPGESKRFCAEHRHDIPSFAKLTTKVDALDGYVDWLEHERFNAARFSAIAVASVAGLAIVGPLAFMAAPAIGGAVGAATGLSGAAATSHGLALLGGGSLAAGGFGMAGGTAVVTAVGAGLGSASGASVANAYVRTDRSFGFEKLRDGKGETVIFANGFLSEGKEGWGHWQPLVDRRYPDATVYRLTWGAKELKSLALLATRPGARIPEEVARRLAAQATTRSGALLGPLGAAFTAASIAKNPWHVARARADMTGAVLADAIVRSDLDDVVLVGFSLGGRVMVSAAESLAASARERPRIRSMHLMGAAAGTRRPWLAIEHAVREQIWNYWSRNDTVLRYLFRAAEAGTKAIGCEGLPMETDKLRNVDVSKLVASHLDHVHVDTLR